MSSGLPNQPRKNPLKITEYLGVLLFAGVLIWWLIWPAFQNARDGFSAKDWPTTTAKVTVASESRSSGSSSSPRTSYRFRYEYQVEDQTYTGYRYSLRFPSGSQGTGVRRYGVGDSFTVHYNPEHPARSVVDANSSSWWNYVVLFGSIGIGGGSFVVMHRRRREKETTSESEFGNPKAENESL